MPTAQPSGTAADKVPTPQQRKSSRLKRSKMTFDPSDVPTHDLISGAAVMLIAGQAKKCTNYDELTACAVKANIQMQVCKDKARIR